MDFISFARPLHVNPTYKIGVRVELSKLYPNAIGIVYVLRHKVVNIAQTKSFFAIVVNNINGILQFPSQGMIKLSLQHIY